MDVSQCKGIRRMAFRQGVVAAWLVGCFLVIFARVPRGPGVPPARRLVVGALALVT